MENDKKYDEIKEQVKILNEKFNSAVSEEDWQDWNTQMNKVGKLIEDYGRTSYNRTKKINNILGIK
ncbi:hypothetical protein [Raineya orbicola]|uniref:Uncharacterized protein n=1 Tax=Raineya orbicola TaxID=2016530 RepID=A0A2N3I324_9BACT|nr:hypothetical protein [Raineya orbicola]PKQ64708.1 hypothetical protein Rain11_2582 [Raineya orbicola]